MPKKVQLALIVGDGNKEDDLEVVDILAIRSYGNNIYMIQTSDFNPVHVELLKTCACVPRLEDSSLFSIVGSVDEANGKTFTH